MELPNFYLQERRGLWFVGTHQTELNSIILSVCPFSIKTKKEAEDFLRECNNRLASKNNKFLK